MTDPLLRFRPEFPILARKCYLVSHSLGAMPRGVPARLAEYAELWAEAGVEAWERGWWPMPVEVGNEIAPLLGAGPGEIVMFPNVTLAQATVLSAVPLTPERNRIVMTELDFPSVRYVFDQLAPRLGAEIVVVPSADGVSIDLDQLLEVIDDRTALVAVSHVLFRSAYVMDAEAICRRAHAAGALVSLDAFHSVGILPFDVHRLGVDFLTGGVLKWLCGGPGGSFLYASDAVRDTLRPSITGWLGHARPFGFEPEMEAAPGAQRWLSGTPAIPALYAAIEGPRILRQATVQAIRDKSTRQTERLIALADERGFKLNSPREAEKRGGTVSIEPPNAQALSRHLLARDIVIDYRPGAGIRVAPHFYTSDEELEVVMGEIDAALESGSWRQYA